MVHSLIASRWFMNLYEKPDSPSFLSGEPEQREEAVPSTILAHTVMILIYVAL